MPKTFTVPPKPQPANEAGKDAWVTGATPTVESMVRFTFDVPESLHRRIKIACAKRGIKRVSVELRRILEREFPEE